jgi:subtilisin-like proprotein convertase family protein
LFVVFVATLLLVVAALIPLGSHARPLSAHEEVQVAWQRAQQAGVYRFATEIVQTTFPAPKLVNVGRSSRQDTLHIEGQTNLPDRSLLMSMWQGGGNVLDVRDGVEVRVQGDRAYGRQIGGTWEEIPDFSNAFAPGSDLMAYLASAKNVRREARSEEGEPLFAPRYTLYSFDVDGPAFARYLRDQLERHLIEKGELPAGLSLESSSLYRGVSGQGQIWIDDAGLPLRLAVHLNYLPEENGDRVEAQIKTDFSGFDRQRLAVSQTWTERLASASSLPRMPGDWQKAGWQAGVILSCIGLLLVLTTQGKSKKVYAALVVALVFSMVVTPLLESRQAAAFMDRQAVKQAALEQEQGAQAAARDLQEQLMTPDWDAQRNPLAMPDVAGQMSGASTGALSGGVICTDDEKANDKDQDGLSDCQERQYQTNPNNPDTDGDGLLDGWEVLRLGTEPGNADSDGDGILDGAEVRGFDYNGRHWYLNPNSVDSNNDGRPDSLECPDLQNSQTCPDADSDGTPDLFDRDDDGDGVSDRIDTAPAVVVGQALPFSGTHPFELVVNGLNARQSAPNQYYPVLVDLQLRPVVTDHLTYALNVLDWPSGDEKGQVQRRTGNNSTFATYMSAQDANNDPRNKNGDLRLIPMLEIEISGDDIPLPLTTTLRTRVQAQGVDTSWPISTMPPVFTTWLSATVNLSQVGGDTRLDFQLQVTSPVTAEIHAGTCNGGVLEAALGAVSNGQTRTISNRKLLTLADGGHVVVLKAEGHTAACATVADIPNGPYTDKMIDTEPLRAYGASARDLSSSTGPVLLSVPLNVVADETGGGRAAFSARIPYLPHGPSLGQPQKARVVWLVQMLTDYCRPMPPGSEGTNDKWCEYKESWALDNTQIVHTYYDDWYLTGLTVREDHGTDVAIAWEDPAYESQTNRQYDDWLWLMALGLEETYLAGRDQDKNTLRDMGVVTYTDGIRVADTSIAGRFNSPLAPSVTITDRLGVPLTATLNVKTFSYPQQDYIAYVMMTETVKILGDNFTAYKDQGADAPTLLFIREERYRAAELGMGGLTTVAGAQVAFDLQGRSVETQGSLSWAPYRYKDGRWQSYPTSEYWDKMYARFTSRFTEDASLPADWRKDVALGQVTLAQSHYLSMMQGRVGLLAVGDAALQYGKPPTDDEVAQDVQEKGGKIGDAVRLVSDTILERFFDSAPSTASSLSGHQPLGGVVPTRTQAALKAFGESVSGKITARLPFLKRINSARFSKGVGIGMGVATVAAIGLGVAGAFVPGQAGKIIGYVAKGIAVAVAAVSAAKAVIQYATCAANQLSKGAKIAGAVGTVIVAAVAIGVMIATIVLGPKTTEAILTAVAAAIGAIIAAVVLFAISLIPVVGQLIVAIIALVDAVVSLVCAAAGWEEGKVGKRLCGGISGLIASYFTPYSYNVMVDLTDEKRLQFNPFDYTILHPEQGLAVGNELQFTVTVTNSIQFAEFPWHDWKALYYFWEWNSSALRSSTFVYRWQITSTDIHENIERGTQNPPWHDSSKASERFPRLADPVTIVASPTGDDAPLNQAGINRPVQLFMAEGYAVPAQECIIVPLYPFFPPFPFPRGILLPVCWVRSDKSTNHTDLGRMFVFDVFPTTLDGFYQAAPKNGGYSLAWGQAGDVTFERQKDLDGDGLLNKANGGSDPDDSQWDTDGDGLSDLYESQHRSDPAWFDTDADGLNDAEEIRLGADPTRKDTDGDGLTDKEEVDGWEFVYAFDASGEQLRTWVTSDPLDADTDGDGLPDFKEKAFGLNPRVVSDPSALGLESQVTETGVSHNPNDFVVRAGDSLRYTSTVENKLDSRFAQGLFSLNSSAPAVLNTAGVPPIPFVLNPHDKETLSGTLQVPSSSASQPVSLTQVAGALIADWREQSSFAEMWLPLNDAATAEMFVDQSGSLPLRNAFCSSSTCPARQQPGYLGYGVRFDGVDDRLVVNDTPGFDFGAGGLTIAMWVNKTNDPRGSLLSWRNAQDNFDVYIDDKPWWPWISPKLKVDLTIDGVGGTVVSDGGSVGLNDWHHVAVVRDGDGNWATYVDGVPRGSGMSAADLNKIDPGTPISLGAGNGAFGGSMDEVYIFRRTLTPEEVAALYGKPVLRLQMEGSTGIAADSSGFRNNATCQGGCPTKPGISGNAAEFNGSNYLSIGSSPSLNLSNGKFTIAAWVYPENRSDGSYDNHVQGIWGRYDGIADTGSGTDASSSFPTLFRIGNKLRFGFGNGSQWVFKDTGDVLTPDAWNHVVVTYDANEAVIYVNNVRVASQNLGGARPAQTQNLYVGRASNRASFYLDRIYVDAEGDYDNDAEVRVWACGSSVWYNDDIDTGETHNIGKSGSFAESCRVDLWEEDGPGRDDDLVVRRDFSTSDPSGSFKQQGTGLGAADEPRTILTLYGSLTNPSIPFRGRLDELTIYKRPLDAAEVNELYLAAFTALHLRLDDAPGTKSLENSVDLSKQSNAFCSGSACPTTGVSGRMNQAALFDGVDDALNTPLKLDQSFFGSATLMAWVYPNSQSGGQHQVLSSDNGGYDWSLLRDGSFWAVFNGSSNVNTGASVDVNRWQHIAAVFRPWFGSIQFYKNGSLVGNLGTTRYNLDTSSIVVGSKPGGGEYFDGRIDDVRIFNTALSDADVLRMFKAAPVFQMHLDDPLGATAFTDDSGNGNTGACSGGGCPKVGEAIKGQIGTAAEFDGLNDSISVPDASLLDLSQFTIGAWVMPTVITAGQQALLDKGGNYGLFISPNSMTATLSFQAPCGSARTVAGKASLMQNQWNHVMATYDGTTARLYLNGYEQGRQAASGSACANAQPLRIGSGLAGRLDEVTLYDHALSEFEVRDIFLYQGKWVEERRSQNILVDNDIPFSTLRSYTPTLPYRANREEVMHVEAHDQTSAVAMAELGVWKDGQPGYTWTLAPLCLDASGGTAWCPTFTPTGEGRYLLQTRATDIVSHTETPTVTYPIYVDGTPPQVGFDFAAWSEISATLHPSRRNTWIVHLGGTVADPVLPGGYPGSGVLSDSVRVALSSAVFPDPPARPGEQVATVSANRWAVDYQIFDAQPSKWYTVTVQARDRIGNQSTTERVVGVDAAAPVTNLEVGAPAMLTSTTQLRGDATDLPVSVVVTWTTSSAVGETGLAITCGGVTRFTAVYTQPVSGEWSDLTNYGSGCQIGITNTTGFNMVTGTARVCDRPALSWYPSPGYSATLSLNTMLPACRQSWTPRSTTCQVQTEFVPNAPGSPYYNERPPAGTALYVPFQDQPDINGALRFQDLSAQRLAGDCQDANCPFAGATGHIGGAALFDGQDDSVRFGNLGAFTTTTVSAWAQRTGATSARETLVSYKEGGNCGAALSLNEDGRSQYPRFAVNVGGVWQSAQASQPIPLDTWVHLAGTYDGQTIRLYRDGQLAASTPAPGAMQQCNGPTTLGSHTSQAMHFFPGLMDEVRILDHALSAPEIEALYRGSGPMLVLPFDEAWTVGGAALADVSGWKRQVVLNTGAGDVVNKAAPGAVGPRALEFDGVDDYAQVSGISLSNASFTAAFWARRDTVGRYHMAIGQGTNLQYQGLHVGFRNDNRFTCAFYQYDLSTTQTWTDTSWHHWACTYDVHSGTRTLYRDGAQVAQDTASIPFQGIGSLQIGKISWGNYFDGALDDVRIYPRPLDPLEVQALYQSGWQTVTLPYPGNGVLWDALPPSGVEGPYRLDLRGQDCWGLVDYSPRSQGAWRGEVDTLAPRVVLTRTTVNGKLRYTATAQDYNLIEPGFSSPCGAGVFTTREPFESPWYVALSGQTQNGNERLYRLIATCDLASIPSLSEAGAHNTPGLAQGVVVSGTYAYVADGHGGLRVVDVSNPQRPRSVGVYPTSGLALDVAVSGRYAYVVVDDPAGDRVEAVDISTPSLPQYAGSFITASLQLDRGIVIGGDNGLVHVPASISGAWGVLILTAISTPVQVYHLLTAGQPRGLAASGNLVYVTEDSGNTLHIFQMSPTTIELGNYALPARGWDVAVSGAYAYVADDTAGLQIVNVSNPMTPTLEGSFNTPGLARGVAISGTHILVADGVRGLQMIDVSIPSFPQSVGALDTPGHAVDVAQAGGYAYVADESTGLRVVTLLPGPAERVTACDSVGNCSIEAVTLPGPPESARVSILNVPPVMDSHTAFAIQGEAVALISFLQALTVSVDGGVLYTNNWANGALTQTAWSTPAWTPTEGPHQVQATVTTWSGGAANDVADINVDTLPPTISILSTVLTTTHYHPPQTLDLTGRVTDTGSLPGVEWRVGGGAWQPTSVVSNTWSGGWRLGGTPDGVTYTVTAQATDVAGHTTLVTQTVLVDLVPPTPVTLTLRSSSGILAPGATVREPSPTLTVTWTASSDGSGLAGYLAQWTAQATTTLSTTVTAYGPAAGSDPYTAGDGQKVLAQLTSQDIYGLQRTQSIGPVYADSPLTPDFLDLFGLRDPQGVYRGWMDSGCSQVGVARRVSRNAPAKSTLSAEQKLYATWNSEALRLTWTGANWNTDGDLFIYLDLRPGGAITAYNPYSATAASTVIYLPGVTPTSTVNAMAADYLVWVRDAQTATLLRWDGSGWTPESNLAQNAQYQFIAALNSGQTDLYLPFGLLGISNPTSTALDMIALASEEKALSLWAAMPGANPVNSPRVGGAVSSAAQAFALAYRYHWASLASSVCPNGRLTPGAPQYTDSDLHASLSVEPAGAIRSMDAAQLWRWQSLGSDPGSVNWLLGMAESGALLGDGLGVTFTLRVQNWGTFTATGALGDVSSYHALRLSSGTHLPAELRDHLVVSLGDIGPGAEISQTFAGTIDRLTAAQYYAICTASRPDYACTDYVQRATLEVRLYDSMHDTSTPPLEWLWSRHLADIQPPEFMGVQQPEYVIPARSNVLVGYAYDASAVPTVTLAITGPSGLPGQLVCPDVTPTDGRWTCAWDTTGAQDGDTYDASVQATDLFGQASAWSKARSFVVDAQPPTVTLDLAASHLDVSNVMGGSDYPLFGQIADNRGLGRADVCVDGRCAPAQLWLAGGDTTHVYEDKPAAPIAINSSTACSSPVVRTFSVTDSFVIGDVSMGVDIEHPRRDDNQAELVSPSGTRVRLLYHSGITGTYRSDYDVSLSDAASSAYSAGSGDDPAAAYYDRETRPFKPLQAFYGENSVGDWTLSVCDLIPSTGDGLYHRSRLMLQPRDTAAPSGDWTFMVRNGKPMDWVTQTVSIYGEDKVGNRTASPLTFEVIVDNVPPVITTTRFARSFGLSLTVAALAGIVSDGGQVGGVFITVQSPEGVYREAAVLDGNAWSYDLHPVSVGIYRLWVTAVDLAGNVATTVPFEVEIRSVTRTYLPIVMRNHASAPDLIVENVIATPSNVQVVIMNRGNAPVEDEFWVDAYIAPHTEPTRVNQSWDQLGSQGLVWGVTADLLPALVPGGTLTLTVGDAHYWPNLSQVSWPLAIGTPVYAQVDSINLDTTYGAVLESHEMIGEDYNNIKMEVVSVTTAVSGAPEALQSAPASRNPSSGRLPRRP